MDGYLPKTFIELLGGIVTFVGLIAGGLSLIPSLRTHSLRLLALFFVASLALFSNNWMTYFTAIFVIATAVTELEFLQNLAAIVRGNKEYFAYKTESLTSSQIIQKLKDELAIAGQAKGKVDSGPQHDARTGTSDASEPSTNNHATSNNGASTSSPSSTPPDNGSNLNVNVAGGKEAVFETREVDLHRVLKLETKALDTIQRLYSMEVQRSVRLSRDGMIVELDGLIKAHAHADGSRVDKIFEVKYFSRIALSRFVKTFAQAEYLSSTYTKITNRPAITSLVLVFEDPKLLTDKVIEKLRSLSDIHGNIAGYITFFASDLLDE